LSNMKLLYWKVILLLCLIATASGSPFEKKNDDFSPGFWKTVGFGVGAVVGVILAPFVGPYLLMGIGFTPIGVRANSLASMLHCYIGTVAGGSLFAALQSAGTSGIGVGTFTVAALLGGAQGYSLVKDWFDVFHPPNKKRN